MNAKLILFLVTIASSGCDDIWAPIDGGDTGDASTWSTPEEIMPPGNPCEQMAQNSEMVLVDQHGLFDYQDLAPWLTHVPDLVQHPVGEEVSYETDQGLDYGGQLGIKSWDLKATQLSSVVPRNAGINGAWKIQLPFGVTHWTPERDGSHAVAWVITYGDIDLVRERQYYDDVERSAYPYASLRLDWPTEVVGVFDMGVIDQNSDSGTWYVRPPLRGVLGHVWDARSVEAVQALPFQGGGYYQSVSIGSIKWVPYGGVCYLSPPSGLDGG